MSSSPEWLPPKLNFANDYGGNWGKFLIKLYDVYLKDFTKPPFAKFREKSVYRENAIDQSTNKEKGFWHLVQEDFNKPTAQVVIERAEKIVWARAIIDNADMLEIKKWDIKEKGEYKSYLWLKELEYVVVLKHMKKEGKIRGFFVKTAHHVYPYGRRSLERKYNRGIQ